MGGFLFFLPVLMYALLYWNPHSASAHHFQRMQTELNKLSGCYCWNRVWNIRS